MNTENYHFEENFTQIKSKKKRKKIIFGSCFFSILAIIVLIFVFTSDQMSGGTKFFLALLTLITEISIIIGTFFSLRNLFFEDAKDKINSISKK
jgi:hypothetical protein